jgi:CheY-like chemotaxis protein
MEELVLVVDDNPANLLLVETLLSAHGYRVRTAASAGDCLAVLREVQPQIVLMDVRLPDLDGLELTRQLRSAPATRELIIVALTAFAMKGDAEKAVAAGCDGYLTKPIDTRAFPALLRALLEKRRGG